MEISFTQEVTFSVDLSPKDVKELADKMEITASTVRRLAADGDLMDDIERQDHVIAWLMDLPESRCEIQDKTDPDNIEITA